MAARFKAYSSNGTCAAGSTSANAASLVPSVRGLHSSTFRLIVSTFSGIRWVHSFPPVY